MIVLNHATNCSPWLTTTFYECINENSPNVSENLEKLREKENLKMRISTNP